MEFGFIANEAKFAKRWRAWGNAALTLYLYTAVNFGIEVSKSPGGVSLFRFGRCVSQPLLFVLVKWSYSVWKTMAPCRL